MNIVYTYFCLMCFILTRKIIIFLLPVAICFLSTQKIYSQITFKNDISLTNNDTRVRWTNNIGFSENNKNMRDTFRTYPYNKSRVRLVTTANIVVFGSALIGLNELWYANYPRSSFHFFNDNDEWLQMDKVGHAYSTYTESRAAMEMWRWAGLSRKKSIWIGGLTGVAFQSIIEVLDGFSSQYGFSPGDFTANVLGSATFISQELAWNQQKIRLKFSFHKVNYSEPDLEARADEIYGESYVQRMIKDYNGQTYWASANISSFFPGLKMPRWLNISFGYGADGMFGARENKAYDDEGNVVFDRTDIKRYRQWYLSPDLDLERIKTNKKGLKVLFFVLDCFKFPAPALEFSNGSFKGHWIVF
ncbi:MAG TPA: DUF2279 domain-containing protein [Hanamia sp.]